MLSSTFCDELGSLRDDHLIKCRKIRVEHLDRGTVLDLLTKPVPEFHEGAIPPEVASAIFARTGGQPYLAQRYGSKLVAPLNEEQRRSAVQADVAKIQDQVLRERPCPISVSPPVNGLPEALEILARGERRCSLRRSGVGWSGAA
jgi:hypothetical protein